MRYSPTCHVANIFEPLELLDGGKFDSIGLNYVLHCLPGTMRDKLLAVRQLAELLTPGGVLFGATLLHDALRDYAARERRFGGLLPEGS